jgi:hypothetical protein
LRAELSQGPARRAFTAIGEGLAKRRGATATRAHAELGAGADSPAAVRSPTASGRSGVAPLTRAAGHTGRAAHPASFAVFRHPTRTTRSVGPAADGRACAREERAGGKSWGALTFYPDGSVYVNGNPPAANAGVSFENVWFSKTNTGNQAMTLSNGWQAYNSVRVPKVGMYGGVVRFQGAIKAGTSATIGSLPQASYKPLRQVRLTAVANGPVPATIVIETTGAVRLEGVPLNVASLYLSLDGVSYAL